MISVEGCLSHEVKPSGIRLVPYKRGSREVPSLICHHVRTQGRRNTTYELERGLSLNHAGSGTVRNKFQFL